MTTTQTHPKAMILELINEKLEAAEDGLLAAEQDIERGKWPTTNQQLRQVYGNKVQELRKAIAWLEEIK